MKLQWGLMAVAGDVACPCGGKYVRYANGLTKDTKLLCAFSNRLYRYLVNLL